MFVKKSWSTKSKNKKPSYSIVESYRDPETRVPKHHTIMNISQLPKKTIEAIKNSLQDKETVIVDDINISTDDSYTGAGTLAVYRLWKKEKMDKVFDCLTPAQRESVFAMVAQRILNPGSKNALKEDFCDSIFACAFSKNRLDEDELYSVMDDLYDNFYDVQKRLRDINNTSSTLLLYDITSTYFEGTKAENGKHGHSRDKRSDRHQIVIGLVCNEQGIPMAIEVWPGNKTDVTTVKTQVQKLKEMFNIKKAILIGDKGMYSETNIDEVIENGFDYILSVAWQTQKAQLLKQNPVQLSLLDNIGVIEWQDGDKRYIGCASKWRKERQIKQRIEGVKYVNDKLKELKVTAAKGRYYSWTSLRKKIDKILTKGDVKDLWKVQIIPVDEDKNPEEKGLFKIEPSIIPEAVKKRKICEGKFVLQTSLNKEDKMASEVKEAFMQQPQIERAFRNIKSFLKIRPIFHRKNQRIKAHVLICFFSFYLVKKAEIEFREKGISKEAVRVIRHWDKLKLTNYTLTAGNFEKKEWHWLIGDIGAKIKKELSNINWWKSIQGYKRSLLQHISI